MILENKTFNDTFFELSFFSYSPELFIGYSLLQLSLYSVTLVYLRYGNSYVKLPNYYLSGFFIFALAFFLMLNEEVGQAVSLLSSFNTMVSGDYLSFFSKAVICFTISVFFLSLHFNKSTLSLSNSFEYVSFIITSGLGSILLCSSGEIITAYLALELQSISFYLMASSKKNSNYSVESGLKYFVVGAFSSTLFLLGSSFVYWSCGTMNFIELHTLLSLLSCSDNNLNTLVLGFVIIFLSLLIKLAVAPFHLWSIDVYESSPNPTTFFFAVVPKLGLFVLMIRIFYFSAFSAFVPKFAGYCLGFAAFSAVIGSLGGLEQRRLKSLLAYSSISHTGYALMSFSSFSNVGVNLTLYYLVFYMLSSLCFWSIFMFLKQRTTFSQSKLNKEIGDLLMLRKSNPVLSFIIGLSFFSLAGVPPLIGFLIKFGVFFTSIKSTSYFISVLIILLSLISTFYYIRVLKVIFFENRSVGKLYYPVGSTNSILIVIFALLLIVLFIKPSLLYFCCMKAYFGLI